MAALKIRKFSSLEDAEFFLSGGIRGGTKTTGGVYGLVGKTLTFTTPNDTVTFIQGADVLNNTLTFGEIKDQLETAIPTLKVTRFGYDGTIGIIEATPADGVVLAATASTAKTALGFPYDVAVTGKVYTIPETGLTPCLVTMYADVQSGSHVVVTME